MIILLQKGQTIRPKRYLLDLQIKWRWQRQWDCQTWCHEWLLTAPDGLLLGLTFIWSFWTKATRANNNKNTPAGLLGWCYLFNEKEVPIFCPSDLCACHLQRTNTTSKPKNGWKYSNSQTKQHKPCYEWQALQPNTRECFILWDFMMSVPSEMTAKTSLFSHYMTSNPSDITSLAISRAFLLLTVFEMILIGEEFLKDPLATLIQNWY